MNHLDNFSQEWTQEGLVVLRYMEMCTNSFIYFNAFRYSFPNTFLVHLIVCFPSFCGTKSPLGCVKLFYKRVRTLYPISTLILGSKHPFLAVLVWFYWQETQMASDREVFMRIRFSTIFFVLSAKLISSNYF